MNIKIREATLQDLDAIVVLFDTYRLFYNEKSNVEKGKLFLEQRIKNKESVIYVAENEEENLVGFTQLYPLFSSTRMRRMWLLNDLFVDKNFRGLGISKKLIDAAKNLCQKTDACGVSLETEKSNKIGNNLYNKTHFEVDTEHNFYFWTNKQ